MGFRFLDPGPLIDRELELVTPAARWIGDMMATTRHPAAATDVNPQMSERQLLDFVTAYPGGHEPGNVWSGRAPAYHFWLRLRAEFSPPVSMAGTLSLRIGNTEDLHLYLGHIGYGVHPAARGNHYAERACRLALPLAAAHGMTRLWITANPENIASRRTLERLGAEFVEIVELPKTHPLYLRGERKKCRYRVKL